jgi:hypothetical protein
MEIDKFIHAAGLSFWFNLVEWAIVLHGMYESIFSIEMIHNCKKKYTYMPCGQHF